jgi:UDP-glucuronate decarboxylase
LDGQRIEASRQRKKQLLTLAQLVGNPNPEISMRDLALECGRVLNHDVKFDTVEHPDTYPADEPQRRCPDITKVREQCGYEPKVSLQDGLTRFFGWADRMYRET